MIQKKIIISCIVKNEEKNLNNFFDKIDEIIKKFKDYFIIIVESDSKDNSYEIVKKNLKKYKGKLLKLNTTKYKFRTEKISFCRNSYLNYIKKSELFDKYDYLFVMDIDNVNNKLKPETIINTIENAPSNWAGLFPNQLFYYDLWALRIKKKFEQNPFEKILKINQSYSPKYSYYKCFFKYFFIMYKYKKNYIDVQSAFGGFGIYKLKYIKKSLYDSNNGKDCEHVNFNKSIIINSKKKLYVSKNLLNNYGFNDHFFKSIVYTLNNYYADKLIKNYQKIFISKRN